MLRGNDSKDSRSQKRFIDVMLFDDDEKARVILFVIFARIFVRQIQNETNNIVIPPMMTKICEALRVLARGGQPLLMNHLESSIQNFVGNNSLRKHNTDDIDNANDVFYC